MQQEGKFETDLEAVLQKKKTTDGNYNYITGHTNGNAHTYNDCERTNVNISSSTTRRHREAAID